MKNKTLLKVILPSVGSLVMAGGLIAGATYALFTSETKNNIAVTSGDVKMDSAVDESSFRVYSASTTSTAVVEDAIAGSEEINASDARWDDSGQEAYKATYYYERQLEAYSGSDGDGYFFSTSGHAAIDVDQKHVTLSKMVPGDRVVFNIDVTNESNIDIKYRLRFGLDETESLYSAEHTLADARAFAAGLKYSWGDKSYSKWHSWKASSVVREKTLWFDFELPILAGEAYKDKLAYFTFSIEAVQGNAFTSDPVEPMETDTKVVENDQPVDLETPSATVHVPAGAVDNGTELHLEVEPGVEGSFAYQTPAAGSLTSFEVTVVDENGVKVTEFADPDAEFDASIYLGVVDLYKFYHQGSELELVATKAEISTTKAFYDLDPESEGFGWIFFKTKSFSPFVASYKYAGGLGTQEWPYLVETFTQLRYTNTTIIQNYKTKKSYFKLVANITARIADMGSASAVVINGMNADFDGNGYMITVESSSTRYPYLFYQAQNLRLHNLDVTINDQALIFKGYDGLVYEDVDVYGYLNVSNNSGAYLIYAYYDVTFIDCDSYVDIKGQGTPGSYNAVYLGYAFDQLISFDNCHNKGSIVCGKAVMFVGNINNSYTLPISITNCSNDGVIQWCDTASSQGDHGFYNQFVAGSGQCIAKITMDGVEYTDIEQIKALQVPVTGSGKNVWGPQDETLAIAKTADDTLEVTQASIEDAVTYQVTINTYAGIDEGGSRQIAVSVEFSSDAFVDGKYNCGMKPLNFVDQYWVQAHPEAVQGTLAGLTIYTLGGVSYYYAYVQGGSFGAGGVAAYTSVSVSCYDASGTPLASATML